jgi:methyl-accepting chemotaxis protein
MTNQQENAAGKGRQVLPRVLLDSRLGAILLTAIGLGLLWQKDWLGLIACAGTALVVWKCRPSARAASAPAVERVQSGNETAAAAPESLALQHSGVALMTEHIVPLWSRQLAAIQMTLQSGSVELLSNFASIIELQDQLHTQFVDLPVDSARTEALQQIDTELQAQCERALHGLQFADRLSQMVEILNQDTERFSAELPNMAQAGTAEAQRWAEAMEARFTTDEQRMFHHGKPLEPRLDNVEFF